jgi:hypothetical protein
MMMNSEFKIKLLYRLPMDCHIVFFRDVSDFKRFDRFLEQDGGENSFYINGVLCDSRCGSRKDQRSRLGKVIFNS